MESNNKSSHKEALMYLSEIIQANRAVKELMLKNTYYSILLMSGVFFLFDSRYSVWYLNFLPAILILIIGIFSILIISSNKTTIESLRSKERLIIKQANLKLIKRNWAGDSLKLGNKNPFYWAYFSVVSLSGIILFVLLMWNALCFCSNLSDVELNQKRIVETLEKEN